LPNVILVSRVMWREGASQSCTSREEGGGMNWPVNGGSHLG